MSDIVVICITIIITIGGIVFLVERGRKFKLKVDAQNKTLDLSSHIDEKKDNPKPPLYNNLKKQNEIVSNTFNESKEINALEGKAGLQIAEYYNNISYNDYITRLEIYKEYSQIVMKSTVEVFVTIISYIAANHILNKNSIEYENYIIDRRLYLISIYDDNLKQADNPAISSLTINKICGFYEANLYSIIRDFYLGIYTNHLEQENKRRSFIKNLSNLEPKDRLRSFDVFASNNFTETTIKDAAIVKESLQYIQSFLLGIFHDRVKENGLR